MIGAEVEHGRKKGRKAELPPRLGSAVVGLAGGLLRRVIITARRVIGAGRLGLFGRRIGIPGFAQTVAAEQEDLGVFHQAVGDGGGDGRIEKDVPPVRERRVGSNNRGALLAMTRGDDLIKQVGGLLIEGQVS